MRRVCLALAVTVIAALPGWAGPRAALDTLYDSLRMSDVIAVMQTEGLTYGEELRDEMFPGRGGTSWPRIVATLYDVKAMDALVRQRFDTLLDGVEVEPLLAYFDSETGQRIVRLELEARRAMMDDSVEAAAKETLQRMQNEGDPRLDVLDRFVAANDLVESNVVGAMNSNYAFYIGLRDGGAFPDDMSEQQVLSDVWSQEPEIRADTLEWVYSYLALAYQPLSDEEIDSYTEVSQTPAGRALNQAIFGAFDTMYTTISRALGQGAAQFILGEDI